MNFWVKDCLRFLEWLVLGILVSFFAGVLSIFCVDISSLVSLLSCFLFILFFCMFSCGFVAIFCCFRVVNVLGFVFVLSLLLFFGIVRLFFFLLLCRHV